MLLYLRVQYKLGCQHPPMDLIVLKFQKPIYVLRLIISEFSFSIYNKWGSH